MAQCLVYLDDIFIVGKTFDRLFVAAGLKLKEKKCNQFATEEEFLGHIFSAEGIATRL